MRISLALAAVLALGLAPLARAAEPVVWAVFSAGSAPYQEALAGLKETAGAEIRTEFLDRDDAELPEAAGVIVAFGAKAALRRYPRAATVIYAMAPGAEVDRSRSVVLHMEPEAGMLIARLQQIAPSARRIGVLWESPSMKAHAAALAAAGQNAGLTIEAVKVAGAAEVPERLRALYGKVDLIWLPPDPLLLNAQTLPIFIEFSRSNRLPLIVPTGGLVEKGATAAIGPSFKQLGRVAGLEVRDAEAGRALPPVVYPAQVEVTISRVAAEQTGLKVPAETLSAADKVLP